jgi:hypothetical protein
MASLLLRFLYHTHDTQHSVGLLWKSDQLVAETSTWQHTQHSHPTKPPCHRRDSNPAISAGERPQTDALARAGNWTKFCPNISRRISVASRHPHCESLEDRLTCITSQPAPQFYVALRYSTWFRKKKSCVDQVEELPDTRVRKLQQRPSGTAMPTHCCRQIEDGFRYRGL